MMILFSVSNLQAQSRISEVENALKIAMNNKYQLENVEQLIVVYNEQIESYRAVLVVLEKKDNHWVVKQGPINAGIGKKGFAHPLQKSEGDGKSPTGIFKLGKLFSYEKQGNILLENQQSTKDDKWIDDVNSADYNKHISGVINAKSFENLLLKNDAYKYCVVIEYNRNPIIKGKGSAIFFHLATKEPNYTAGCVAIDEANMKLLIHWLDPNQNPNIIMGNLVELNSGL
ncbi:L,D-transpeptidase family protein [Flavobacterium cellulosilyticum]|nr:L,D-transpeptidase family protein [Flavobacterium cellulosilyticum]